MSTSSPHPVFAPIASVIGIAITLGIGLTCGPAAAATSPPDGHAPCPGKIVRVVVPIAPGGSADKLARTLAPKLGEKWGQSVVVENVAGASGTLGAAQVAKARPDGCTLLLTGEGVTLNAVLFKQLPYDSSRAFRGVSKAVVNPQVLVVRPNLGVKTFREYVQLAKQRPGEVALGLPGNGGIAHVAHEMLARDLAIRVNYVPYGGGGPATVDLLGGHIDATLITLAAVTEYVRAGKLTALAVTTPYRSKALPTVPTMAESGVAGFSVESWQGLLAPSGTPDAVVEAISRDVAAVLQTPQIRTQLEDAGYVVVGSTPQQLDATLVQDLPKYAAVISAAGIVLR